MPKIKEIRKIESTIKEIKKEKVESLDDEIDEEDFNNDVFNENFSLRRSNKTSTLDANEASQDTTAGRERRISKEDEKEISFRPSYTAGNQNRGSAYTPVGSAESSAGAGQIRTAGDERGFGRDQQQSQTQGMGGQQQQGGERAGERLYQDSVQQNEERRERKKNLM